MALREVESLVDVASASMITSVMAFVTCTDVTGGCAPGPDTTALMQFSQSPCATRVKNPPTPSQIWLNHCDGGFSLRRGAPAYHTRAGSIQIINLHCTAHHVGGNVSQSKVVITSVRS